MMKFSSLSEALDDANDQGVIGAIRRLTPPSVGDQAYVIEVKEGLVWFKQTIGELAARVKNDVLFRERPTVLVGKTAANRWPIDALLIRLDELQQGS